MGRAFRCARSPRGYPAETCDRPDESLGETVEARPDQAAGKHCGIAQKVKSAIG